MPPAVGEKNIFHFADSVIARVAINQNRVFITSLITKPDRVGSKKIITTGLARDHHADIVENFGR